MHVLAVVCPGGTLGLKVPQILREKIEKKMCKISYFGTISVTQLTGKTLIAIENDPGHASARRTIYLRGMIREHDDRG